MSEHAAFGVPQWTMGDRLGKSLDYAGISRNDMAVFLECSPNTVTNYTSDKTRVPGTVLRLWAMRTGVPREWLETGSSPFGTGPDDDGGAQSASTLVRSYRTSLTRAA